MSDKVVVGIDDYQAGRDALELANQLVSPRGNLLLVYVEVLMRAPGPEPGNGRLQRCPRHASTACAAKLAARLSRLSSTSSSASEASPVRTSVTTPQSRVAAGRSRRQIT
jgi:hypothetical protein